MFRRPGKNPLEENNSLYQDETPLSSPYKYGNNKVGEATHEPPPRLFDPPHQMGHHRATPMEERNPQEESWRSEDETHLPHHFDGIMQEEEPETTLGEGVTFRGELKFERLLRIDGTFEGDLLSQGKVIVGSKGKVKANLNLREAVIEGEVEGNITVQEKLELRGEASIHGDIQAKFLCVDEGVRLNGQVLISGEAEEVPSPSQSPLLPE
ncbi:MAG: hypothetical protein K940chlam9_00111 [Chlamydiae bacterium]|nr:hypothetical protein [Chlamydiota bacterium]